MSALLNLKKTVVNVRDGLRWRFWPGFRVRRARDILTDHQDSWFFVQSSGSTMSHDLIQRKKRSVFNSLVVKRLAFQNLGATIMVKEDLISDLSDSLFSRNIAHHRVSLGDFYSFDDFERRLNAHKCSTVLLISYSERDTERAITLALDCIIAHISEVRESLMSRSARYVQPSGRSARHLLVLDNVIHACPARLMDTLSELRNSVSVYCFNSTRPDSMPDDTSTGICKALIRESLAIGTSLEALQEVEVAYGEFAYPASRSSREITQFGRRYDDSFPDRSLMCIAGGIYILDSK